MDGAAGAEVPPGISTADPEAHVQAEGWPDQEPRPDAPDAALAAGEALVDRKGSTEGSGAGAAADPWPEPVDLFSEHFPTAITVDESCMPTVLLRFARAEGARLGVDPAGLATLAAGACSGVISDHWKIRLKKLDSWSEAPRLWIAIVSAPGTKKTDQVRSVKRPIDTLEREMRKQWGKDSRSARKRVAGVEQAKGR